MFFKLMMVLSLTLSLMISLVPSPFILCLMVLGLTGASCGLASVFCSQWLSYALVIVFLGGMMVLFTYASSMSVSDKLIKSGGSEAGLVILMMGGMLVTPPSYKVYMGGLYSNLSSLVLLVATFYLLVCLFSVVKVVEVEKGALIS